jgi:membrane-bound lytic murein transglycosylase B
LLGDAIAGRPGLRTSWPIHDRQLAPEQIRELQVRLKKMGYDVGEIDGRAGEILRGAVRQFQEKRGLAPDGYPTLALLKDVESQN